MEYWSITTSKHSGIETLKHLDI